MLADGASGAGCRHESHPAGEIIATAPLFDAGVDLAASRPLLAPTRPMTSTIDRASRQLRVLLHEGRTGTTEAGGSPRGSSTSAAADGPASIRWWADIEARYAGPSHDPDVRKFKFLTLRSPSYAEIAAGGGAATGNGQASLPCACTD